MRSQSIRPTLSRTRHGLRAQSPTLQEPTCGRSLARRFRASNSATRCVAQPRAKGPHAAQRKNVGRMQLLKPSSLLADASVRPIHAATTCLGALVSQREDRTLEVTPAFPYRQTANADETR